MWEKPAKNDAFIHWRREYLGACSEDESPPLIPDAPELAPGVYFMRLAAPDCQFCKKLVVLDFRIERHCKGQNGSGILAVMQAGPVLAGGFASVALEGAGKGEGVGVTDESGDLLELVVGAGQQVAGVLHVSVAN